MAAVAAAREQEEAVDLGDQEEVGGKEAVSCPCPVGAGTLLRLHDAQVPGAALAAEGAGDSDYVVGDLADVVVFEAAVEHAEGLKCLVLGHTHFQGRSLSHVYR